MIKSYLTCMMAGAAAISLGAAAPAFAEGPTGAQLLSDAASTGDVLTYGMGPEQQRHTVEQVAWPDTMLLKASEHLLARASRKTMKQYCRLRDANRKRRCSVIMSWTAAHTRFARPMATKGFDDLTGPGLKR